MILDRLYRARAQRALYRMVRPTGRERHLDPNDMIVTKTDPQGRITYANDTFLAITDLHERQAIGAPHSIIRHPEMPRCIFQTLWEAIEKGDEFFGYVVNLARNGDHYWVFAHVTPTTDGTGRIIGYHSDRRPPERRAIDKARALYGELLAIERRADDRKRGLAASRQHLDQLLKKNGKTFNEFILSL